MEIGLDAVVSTAKRLGIESPLELTRRGFGRDRSNPEWNFAWHICRSRTAAGAPAVGGVIKAIAHGDAVVRSQAPKRDRVLAPRLRIS